MKKLKGKNVLITGAASGIGREMALLFADEGCSCALIDINTGGLQETARLLEPKGVTVYSYTCDISKQSEVKNTVKKVKKDLGDIHVLMNNAGIVTGRYFHELPVEEMQRSMDINFWGHVYFTREILPEMMERKEGAIANVASACGLLGMSGLTDYAASKFADVGFSESLRREVRSMGFKKIRVTCVCPYIIDTGMFDGFKPMLLSPFVRKERAAKRIVNAVKKGRPYVTLPALHVRGMMVLKLLPTALFDWLLRVWGGDKAMSSFHPNLKKEV